ncbi:efflux RND transporter permease subunit [Synoicihabitans lomoniglobus]|uniref:Efflux RND transporter permease subunit n=1 Tax=Synoicihabitans lomoniglobus TaxID=2909285 RepID=A0AAF0CPL8_9BACT|nr:efflux RND transporter permease subunit [Opitutaceae bacterium LMO-M01]WED65419.1 efflux RND transporter permease subunit [Opitutaceae bacterium LMO-M01]
MSAPFNPDESRFAFTTRRPVAILMVVMAISVFGWVSYNRLALTLMPDMSYPSLTVRTEYPGSAPEEIETTISQRLEQELGIVPGLTSISSISKAGQSDVILEFQWETDMNTVAADIREKVDRVRFPDDAERPLLLRYDPTLDPIMRFGLAGPQSLYDLRYLSEYEIKRRLEALEGVAAIKVKGGLEELYLVAIDESRLSTLNLNIDQVNTRLAQGNVNLPGGNLREGQTEYLIRTMNEFQSIPEIEALIVTRQNGVDIRIRDIATITRFHKDREVITAVDGHESIEIEVYKEADANIVEVARRVRDAVYGTAAQQAYIATLPPGSKDVPPAPPTDAKPEARSGDNGGGGRGRGGAMNAARQAEAARVTKHLQMTNFVAFQLPQDARIETLADQSIFISNSITEVKNNAIFGAIIAVIVLFLFLRNLGQTAIIGICIPISIVATFAPMFIGNVSLNIISLGGLALGVGMLVDNAIVVLESIYRCREEGDPLQAAVVRGVSEVGMAVTASTATTVAVFFPIVFVEGVAGQVFGDMSLTVVFSLVASLFAALFFIPMLASRDFSGGGHAIAGKINDQAFLQFPAADDSHGWPRRGRDALTSIGLFLGRTLRAAALLVGLLVKVVLAMLLVPLGPFLWLLDHKKPVAAQRWTRWSAGFAADSFGPLRGAHVWPGVLSVTAPASLGEGLVGLRAWTQRASGWFTRIVRELCVLLVFPFLLLRFGFTLLVRGISTLVQTGALVVVGLVLLVVRIGSLILRPIVLPIGALFNHGYGFVTQAYAPLLRLALAQRWLVLGGSVVAFVVVWFTVLPRLGQELIPQVHQGEFNLDITLPVGTPLERTYEISSRIETAVLEEPEVALTALSAGAENNATRASEAGEHTARLTVRLEPGSSLAEEGDLIARIRSRFRDLPEVKMEVSYPALFSFKSPIEVEVRGHNLDQLKELSRTAEARLAEIPGLVDVRSSLQSGNPEIRIVYHRDRLAEFGLSLRTVAELVRNKVQGNVATEYRQAERLIDVLVRLEEEDRVGLAELSGLIVNPGSAIPIPLSAVADLQVNEGPSEIRRIDQTRTAVIFANLDGADLATVSREIVLTMESLNYPVGFDYAISGQNEEMQTSINSLLLAFALALFLVYIVMASQFESLVQPFLIMMTVPLALIGVIGALWLTGTSVSIMVFIGLIILAGIVVNNAIVLIDYINTLQDRGIERTTAIIEAGQARLRPILMTTMTTVLGLTPMALGLGEGSEIRAPMAITVIAGLAVSTLLTLVVIPTLYAQFGGHRRADPLSAAEGSSASSPSPAPAHL